MKLLTPILAAAVAMVAGSKAAAAPIELEPASSSSGGDRWTRWDADFKRSAAAAALPTFYYPKLKVNVQGWQLLKTIGEIESTLGTNPSVVRGMRNPADAAGSVSSDGKSYGFMQFRIETARDRDPSATIEKLNDPIYSINLAGRHFAWIAKQFNPLAPDYLEFVVKSYNQGVGGSKKEMSGASEGFADAYWTKFEDNIGAVLAKS